MWHYTAQTQQMLLDFGNALENADISLSVKNFLKAWIEPLSSGTRADKSLVAYLVYMTERLVLMKKLLKDTGSIYFHCDPTASHYIKVVMDGIFGKKNFRNEIIWRYNKYLSKRKDSYPRNHDVILFYKKGTAPTYFNLPYEEKETTHSKRGYVPQSNVKEIVIYRDDMITHPKVKRYLDLGYKLKRVNKTGVPFADTWIDVPRVDEKSKEGRGYKTQKPMNLLNRIIEASCPEKGLVMDPFCGCGTACESAGHLGREWVGIDISVYAIEEVKARLSDIGVEEKDKYEIIQDSPSGWDEYKKLDPYQKQDFLIRAVGGHPNPRKSGDGGVDGELRIHLGMDNNKDRWGSVVFSVKTGNQMSPAHLRELKGMLGNEKYDMGVLILEKDPSGNMEDYARKAGELKYYKNKDLPPDMYDRIQILTAGDILLNKTNFNRPPTLQEIKLIREYKQRNLI